MDFEALTNRLELEAQSLREKIAATQHRLSEIETFLKLGRKLAGQTTTHTSLSELLSVHLGPQAGTAQRDRILDAAEKLLSDGRRRSTRELHAELLEFGITPGGVDPVQNLSVYLSRDKDRFSSDVKRGGWTLKWLETGSAKARSEPTAASDRIGGHVTSTLASALTQATVASGYTALGSYVCDPLSSLAAAGSTVGMSVCDPVSSRDAAEATLGSLCMTHKSKDSK